MLVDVGAPLWFMRMMMGHRTMSRLMSRFSCGFMGRISAGFGRTDGACAVIMDVHSGHEGEGGGGGVEGELQ